MISLAEIYKGAAELYAEGHENLEDVMGDISNLARRLTEAETNITGHDQQTKPGHGLLDRSPAEWEQTLAECRTAERRTFG